MISQDKQDQDDNKSEKKSLSPMEVIGALAGIAVVAVMAIPSNPSSSTSAKLYSCEQHTIKQCSIKTAGMYDCIFTNDAAQVPVTPGNWTVWNYDSQEILTKTNMIYGSLTVPPGKSIHIEFFTDVNASESVICSMDPTSKMVTRSRWSVINNSGT